MAGRGDGGARGGAGLRPWAVLPALLFGTVFIWGWEVSPAQAVIVLPPCTTCPAGYFDEHGICQSIAHPGDELPCPALTPLDKKILNMKVINAGPRIISTGPHTDVIDQPHDPNPGRDLLDQFLHDLIYWKVDLDKLSDFERDLKTEVERSKLPGPEPGAPWPYYGVPAVQNTNAPLFRLGMSVAPNSGGTAGYAGIGAAEIRSSGAGVADTAGLLAPGATFSGYRATVTGGNIGASYNASRLVGPDQSLKLYGAFAYSRDNAGYGASPGLAAVGLASGGSMQQDTYSFSGGARFGFGNNYIKGGATINTGRGGEFQNFDSSSGNYTSSGYGFDVSAGHMLTLAGNLSPGRPVGLPTKAAPKTTDGGYLLGLDLGGHLGYVDQRANGFTDSSGFVYGLEEAKFGVGGAQATLVALVVSRNLLWMPYIAATVDQRLGYSHTSFIPAQATLAAGDLLTYGEANTFWGVQMGLDVLMRTGWKVGVKAFYTASADNSAVGGTAFVRIPLN